LTQLAARTHNHKNLPEITKDSALFQQHDILEILGGGTDQWNAFRAQHRESIVLHRATLPGVQLARADLHRAILMDSNLRCADLSCAILERAVLRKTDFRDSNLQQANIDGADLWGANLSGANLREASLFSSFLRHTDLRGSDLSTARGLTDAQIRDAFGDETTKLPKGMARPATWHA
jgi:uncharacterized protein YjbI with pentapeptide repeats